MCVGTGADPGTDEGKRGGIGKEEKVASLSTKMLEEVTSINCAGQWRRRCWRRTKLRRPRNAYQGRGEPLEWRIVQKKRNEVSKSIPVRGRNEHKQEERKEEVKQQENMVVMSRMVRKRKRAEWTQTTVGGSVTCWLLIAKSVASSRMGGYSAAVVLLAARNEEQV